jgi:hypothetical protein
MTMNSDDLDASYTALSEALGRVGPEKAQLLLATLSLALIAREGDAVEVAALIDQAERLSLGGARPRG